MHSVRSARWVRPALLASLVALATGVARAEPPGTAARPAADPAAGPASGEEDLGPLLARVRSGHHVPALCAALIRHDKVTAIGVDGHRRAGDPKKATVDDLWHLGSCTKSMTATLCAKLVEQKVLSFEDTLGSIGTGFLPRDADAGWQGVTLEQLLTNRAGAPTELNADGLWAVLWKREGTPVEQRRRLLEGVVRRAPSFAPGKRFQYSNAGFSIAGLVAETRAHSTWEALIRAKLFDPLGMTSAAFGPPGTKGTLDQPRGHTAAGVAVEPGVDADNPPAIAPAGLVHMTIRDWAKYVSMHLLGGRGESSFLSKASFDRLHVPPEGFDYAMGWAVTQRPWGGGTVWTHNGSNTMWFCVTWIAPRRDFAVVITCNQGGDDAAKACDDVAAALVTR